MQNFPNNIVLTSLSYHKYYTMCRCLSMTLSRLSQQPDSSLQHRILLLVSLGVEVH